MRQVGLQGGAAQLQAPMLLLVKQHCAPSPGTPTPSLLASGRESCGWVFDAKSCCLIMFGGWANRWLGDAWKVSWCQVP